MFSRLTNFIRRDRILVPEEEDVELEQEPLIERPHTRRFFFGIMAGAAASAVVVPKIVAPSLSDWSVDIATGESYSTVAEWSANRILTIQEITNEMLVVLQKNMGFSAAVNRQFDAEFAPAGHKIGYTMNIRKPRRFVQAMSPDGYVSTIPVNLATA